MAKQTFSVPGISCEHCVRTIIRELASLDGVQKVAPDAVTKEVRVTYQAPADEAAIRARLKEIGQPAAG